MKETILSTEKLCKSFSNEGRQQHVIRNLDLEIYKGDFTIIMGSSGAGKSTLMYMLSGMDTPSLGKIYFAGEDISGYSSDRLALFRRKHCGFVFQQNHLLDHMSVMDNILITGLLVTKSRRKLEQRAKDLFSRVNITEEQWTRFPSRLSGGEQQRAGMVRALINDPKIVFADEPTGALNSVNGQAVLDVFSNVNQMGQSIIMVTHDMKSAMRGNRIIYLSDGVVKGDIRLENFEGNTEKRSAEVHAFLQEMGW